MAGTALFIVGFYLECTVFFQILFTTLQKDLQAALLCSGTGRNQPYANATPTEPKELDCISIGCPTTLPFGNYASSTLGSFDRAVKQGPLPSLTEGHTCGHERPRVPLYLDTVLGLGMVTDQRAVVFTESFQGICRDAGTVFCLRS